MAKSKETFNKREKEKKRIKQRQEKKEKMEMRKANAPKSKSLDDMMAYLDENGNLTSTPSDPRQKKIFNADDIQIGVPKWEAADEEPRQGTVQFFNEAKGFGFINDMVTGERLFVHINQCKDRIAEGDRVTYDVVSGEKGLSAQDVRKL